MPIQIETIKIKDFKDLVISSETIILCYETKTGVRLYYDMVLQSELVVYFYYMEDTKSPKKSGFVTIGDKNELLFSECYKLGYKKIVEIEYDRMIERCLATGEIGNVL